MVPLPKNGSSTTSPGRAGSQDDPVEQRFRLLGGMGFLAVRCEPFAAGADRQQPIAAHLQVIIQGLHGVVVEGVARCWGVAAQIRVSWALVKRTPRKFGIGLVLIQTTSFRIQNPRSCRIVPTRKILWYVPITHRLPVSFSRRRPAQARIG